MRVMHRILRILLVFVLLAAAGFAQAPDFAETKKKAEAGDAEAQSALGYMYANGTGVPKDDAEAVKWFRKAADQGNAMAQNNLGYMYANGTGVPKDDAEAVKWYRKAADQGNMFAQYNLGFMCENGNGLHGDDAEAVRWFRKAADQGNVAAQSNLGLRQAAREQAARVQEAARVQAAREQEAAREQAAGVQEIARVQAAREQTAAREEAARKQAAKDRYAKYTGGVAKLVIKGLAIGMSIDAALEVVNERFVGALNEKYEIKPSESSKYEIKRSESSQDTSGAYLSPTQKINQYGDGLLMLAMLSNDIDGLPLSFSIKCEVNNDAVTRIVLPAALTNALFNTADMQASDFLLQIRQNYGVGLKAGDWTVFQFYKSETNWTGWEYSSPEGYRIRVFDSKAIEMKKIPKSNERNFN